MKLLLDENLPQRLRLEIEGHDVFTVAYMGWSGIVNGELLRLAAESGFEAIITNDHGMEYEQNQAELPLSVIVLGVKCNTMDMIRPLLPRLVLILSNLQPCCFVRLDV